MEKRMEECTRELTKDPGVNGVVCTDMNGALYCGQGSLNNAHSSAVVSQLANLATALEPNSQPLAISLSYGSAPGTIPPPPPSSIGGSQQQAAPNATCSKVLIKTNGVITVAVHK